ncbi:right-handed parallel beta-helix repeat-containing protein [Shewanella sp. VB17]|uniref:right-handed parallel beta-helix repeat-containing protein n=1 Tax=Shewanella sp. VB17 TaxID=2739432 RepID=UPI001562F4F7|nr:right-handed parallel beta-helix repeat-containing protein [Shewanella sp. VB17]NRD71776.1 right-handed parallel beta-helix repeat-containing protein [Shewanella sp. VB17]
MKLIKNIVAISCCVFSFIGNAYSASVCTIEQKAEILAPVTHGNKDSLINCNLTLSPNDVITQRVQFIGNASSNVTLDCNGGRIDMTKARQLGIFSQNDDAVWVRSQLRRGEWHRPEHVTIKNCKIVGGVRVWGISKNGEGKETNASSHKPGHVNRLRSTAPYHTRIINSTITSDKRTHLYIATGASNTLVDSVKFRGYSDSVSLYLGAETTRTTIKNSYFYAGGGREKVAIDASNFNVLEGNYFSGINNGGIYLYRNCGEGGTIRYTTPSHNTIRYNKFYYNKYKGSNKAISMSSRDGNRSYCDDDGRYKIPNSSSTNNRDFAVSNVIFLNQFLNRNPERYMTEGASALGKNTMWGNLMVNKFTNISASTAITRSSHQCRITGNNAGCGFYLGCPVGYEIVGARSNCNLEWPPNDAKTLKLPKLGKMWVSKSSDRTSHGVCLIGKFSNAVSMPIDGIYEGANKLYASCKEYDRNGGDCGINAEVVCAKIR